MGPASLRGRRGPKRACDSNRLIQSGSPCVNDPENLRRVSGYCAASCVAAWEEVVAVALVEPDFVVASQAREGLQGRSSVNIDHGRIIHPAAEHDLIIRADGHTSRSGTVAGRNREIRHELRV